ncbi:MAG TPA: hypothetical protein VD994_09710 [Prosthecobacter sp.]|nr:hypothetical protein [Prosthecobacter sp.]
MVQEQRRLRLTPKELAIHDIEVARNALGEHLYQAAAEFNPRNIVSRSVSDHRWLWIGGAMLGGLALVRLLLPSRRKIERDNNVSSATKSGLIALILAPMLGMVRRAALNYATNYAKGYFSKYLSRHEGGRPRA